MGGIMKRGRSISPEAAQLVLTTLSIKGLLPEAQVDDMVDKAENFLRSIGGRPVPAGKSYHTPAAQPPRTEKEAADAVHAFTKKTPPIVSPEDVKDVKYPASNTKLFVPGKMPEFTDHHAGAFMGAVLNEKGRQKYRSLKRIGGDVIEMARQAWKLALEKRLNRRVNEINRMASTRNGVTMGLSRLRKFRPDEIQKLEADGLKGTDLLLALAREYGVGL